MKKTKSKSCAQFLTGTVWHLKSSSFKNPHFEEIVEGAIAIDGEGHILEAGKATSLRKKYQPLQEISHDSSVLLPGFIDTHLHFPQMNQIGCHGESLLGWLDKYIFPEEAKMSQASFAKPFAPLFFKELLANGTTTSLSLSSSDFKTTSFLFEAAEKTGVRAVIGKVSMDRGAPKTLLRDPLQDKEETEELIKNWHGKQNRLFYALTPRFSPSCTPKLLRVLGDLAEKHPSVRIQTHFSENADELKLVKKLFPKAKDYLATYEEFGLLGPRTVLAHCVHSSNAEIKRFSQKEAHVSHCPTSNLFLGSGLFPLKRFSDLGINLSVGTDIGAGTSFSIWHTLGAVYQIQRLQHQDISTSQLFYLATLGGAKALGLEKTLGNFESGKSADIQVIDWKSKPLLKARMHNTRNALDRFFSLLFYFEKDLVQAVYVQGKKVFS